MVSDYLTHRTALQSPESAAMRHNHLILGQVEQGGHFPLEFQTRKASSLRPWAAPGGALWNPRILRNHVPPSRMRRSTGLHCPSWAKHCCPACRQQPHKPYLITSLLGFLDFLVVSTCTGTTSGTGSSTAGSSLPKRAAC